MASTSYLRMMVSARMRLPGALDPAIQVEYFSVMNEFLEDSNVWTEVITFPTVPNVTQYSLAPFQGGFVTRLLGATNVNGVPVAASMPTPGNPITVDLAVTPQDTNNVNLIVAKTCDDPVDSDGNPVFPDWILNKYSLDILNGVVGRMMTQPAKPYTNAQQGLMLTKMFIAAKMNCKNEAAKQNTFRAQRWTFPQDFANRRFR